ncbi:hypothetical protein CCPUN_00600 [Cardinium endosymbiont of Culicoides punctatus]|nr:hypothetical protein CCPUN_00600 [Cardinium endosymbiont of Culicoides punctatus]
MTFFNENSKYHDIRYRLLKFLGIFLTSLISLFFLVNTFPNFFIKLLRLPIGTIVLSTFFIFLPPSLIYLSYVDRPLCSHIFSNRFRLFFSVYHILILLGIALCMLFIEALIMESQLVLWPLSLETIRSWAIDIEKTYYYSLFKELLTFSNPIDFIWKGLCVLSLFPAIIEEIFFRGILQNLLVKKIKKPFIGIVITSMLFSLLHMRPYGSILLFGMGLLLGYIYFISGHIIVPIFIHFIHNSIICYAAFFQEGNCLDINRLLVKSIFPFIINRTFALLVKNTVYRLVYKIEKC